MLADMRDAIDTKSGGEFSYPVSHFHRSIGARISGENRQALGEQPA